MCAHTGVTCRFARSHTYTDESMELLRSITEQKPSGGDGADADGDGDDAAEAAAAVAATAAALWLTPEQLAAPVPSSIEKPINSLDREVQSQLWKHR